MPWAQGEARTGQDWETPRSDTSPTTQSASRVEVRLRHGAMPCPGFATLTLTKQGVSCRDNKHRRKRRPRGVTRRDRTSDSSRPNDLGRRQEPGA